MSSQIISNSEIRIIKVLLRCKEGTAIEIYQKYIERYPQAKKTLSAIRANLLNLKEKELIYGQEIKTNNRGRPKINFCVSPKGMNCLPKPIVNQITNQTIRELHSLLSKDNPKKFFAMLAIIGQNIAMEMKKIENSNQSVKDFFCSVLKELGHEFDYENIKSEDRLSYQFKNYRCIFKDLKPDIPEICIIEKNLIQYLLPSNVSLNLTSNCNSCECMYSIKEKT